jgi:hypothetical protein
MTEKKLAQSLDDIIGSSGKGGGGRAAGKAAAPQQQGSGGKAKAGKPQHFARGATKVIPITIRTQGRNAGPRSKPSAQQHVPGLKGVRHVPATSPARLQKALGGGGAGVKSLPASTSRPCGADSIASRRFGDILRCDTSREVRV